jgi:hypothetical protein
MLSTVALLGSLLSRTSGTTSKIHYLKYFLALFSYIVFIFIFGIKDPIKISPA